MIGFGICVGSQERADRWARPGIERSGDPSSPLLVRTGQRSICAAYNSILEEASGWDLDALVLIHDDVELRDGALGNKLRSLFADSSVGVVGAVGARNVRSLAWWEGQCRGRAPDTFRPNDYGGGTHEADTVDGLLLALSPWAMRNVRFDQTHFGRFHGYDADYCFQLRAHGRTVLVTDLDLYHHTKGGYGNHLAWKQADMMWQRKWRYSPATPGDRLRWQLLYRVLGIKRALRAASRR